MPATAPPAPNDPALATRLALLREIADNAEPVALEHYQKPSLKTERKPDGSVVTPADRDIERMARQRIERHFPDDHITGEELPNKDGTSEFRWIIDPIDGTDAYARGIPSWANLLAVAQHEKPTLAIANFPAIGERLTAATDRGCLWTSPHHPPQPARVSQTAALPDAFIELTRPGTFHKHHRYELFNELIETTTKTRSWSDAHAFATVATGQIDAAVAFRMSVWDVAPFEVIITEAGGRITEWNGSQPLTGKTTLATNNALHQQLTDIIAAHDTSNTA